MEDLPLTPLPGGAWYRYVADWMAPREADLAFEALRGSLAWEERHIFARGKPVLQPRLVAWAGALPYRYSGQVLEPRGSPAALDALWRRVESAVTEPFDHVVGNLYRDGRDHVAFHADNEPVLGKDPLIASVSLGAERLFVLRPKWTRRTWKLRLAHGSLLVMGGRMQHSWRHAVPKTGGEVGPRLNLTFRQLRHPERQTG